MQVRIASPPGYELPERDVDRLRAAGRRAASCSTGPAEAVRGADVVYTDVWTSMGQEAEADQRRRAFEGFTVDDALMSGGRRRRHLPALPAGPSRRGGRRPRWSTVRAA